MQPDYSAYKKNEGRRLPEIKANVFRDSIYQRLCLSQNNIATAPKAHQPLAEDYIDSPDP